MSNESRSEQDLWDSARNGHGESFGSIFDMHRQRVLSLARKLASPEADPEDILALAFLEMWRRRQDVRVIDGSVLPWLLATTANVTRNELRSHRRYRAFLQRLPPAASEPDPADEVNHALDRAGRRELIDAIQRLTPKNRDLVILVAIEGLTLSEASRALGISYAAGKVRLSRVRRALEPAALETRASLTGGSLT